MPAKTRVPSGREPRIVVVDDEPTLLARIAMILREENYDVFEAHNAAEAIDHLRSNGADLLLSDAKVPHTSGLSLIRWLSADPALRHIPVIFLTSAAEEESARALGAFDCILKPVRREELLRRVFGAICVSVMRGG